MINKPKVLSIVTVCLNDLSGLKQTVDSLLSQKNVDLGAIQHVIIDGGSMDGTLEYLTELGSRFNHIQFVSEKDEGIYSAMNKGLSLCESDFVQFLNSGDSLSSSDALQEFVVATKERGTSPIMVVAGASLVGDDGHLVRIRNQPHFWSRHALGIRPHCHQAMIFETKLAVAIGGYSTQSSFVADFEFILKMGLSSKTVHVYKNLVNYAAGGVSHQRRKEIPLLLHQVRSRAFEYGKVATVIDLSWVYFLQIYRTLKPKFHFRKVQQ